MVIFHSYVNVYQRVTILKQPVVTQWSSSFGGFRTQRHINMSTPGLTRTKNLETVTIM